MRNQETVSIGGMILLVFAITHALILREALADAGWYRALYISLPLLLIAIIGIIRKPGTKP